MPIDQQTVVIGGGISGLVCAYQLQQLGVPVLLLEAADRLGGVIASTRRNGFLFESGPQCPRFPRAVRKLVRDLGLEPQFLRAHARARRYILKDGQLYPAPLSPWALLATSLVGFRDKARFLAEPFAHANPPDSEESLADFIRRKFGSETLDYLVEPFVSAVFFSDPEDMGMESALPSLARWERQHGSVFRGAIKSRKNGKRPSRQDSMTPYANQSWTMRLGEALPPLGSFKNGLAALTDTLAEKLVPNVRLCARAEILRLASDSSLNWLIRLNNGEEIAAQSVILATPAYAAAALLHFAAPHLSSLLREIPYLPLAVVCSAYDRAQVRHSLKGFGFAVPRREGLHVISSTWNSSIFPGRAPADKVLITNFARPLPNEPFLEMAAEEIAAAVEGEVAPIVKISGSPVDRMVCIHRNALPHFRIGHAARIAKIREAKRAFPGLHLVGNYFAGRSIGDCIENAFVPAEDVSRELQSRVLAVSQASVAAHDN
jgi:protoporphyrinogen/coproporphyrinogen III oxidase